MSCKELIGLRSRPVTKSMHQTFLRSRTGTGKLGKVLAEI
jgi:hypothetical protein